MRHSVAQRALVVVIGLGGATAGACFSSSSGGPSPGDDAAAPDASVMDAPGQTEPDSTVEGGQPEAATDAGVPQDAGKDSGADAGDAAGGSDGGPASDAGEAGGPGILLPGSIQTGVRIGVNHATSKFYVAWAHTTPSPATYGISVIDAKTGAISGTIDVRAFGNLAVDEANDLIYVPTVNYADASGGVPSVVVVDGTNDTEISAKTIYQAQGQTLDAGQSVVLANLGMDMLAVDPAGGHLFALLGDAVGNSFVFEYDTTSGALLGSIEIAGSEPSYGDGTEVGGGLVLDPTAHALWVVTGTRPAFGPGAVITTIDSQTFTVTATTTKELANSTDVTLDQTADLAVAFVPPVPVGDGGGTLPTPASPLTASAAGSISSAFVVPAGLAASFGRVLGSQAYVYANDDAGSYYLLGFNVPDAGQWSLHGQSSAILPQPQPASFETGSVLNAYSFEVVTDATRAYVIAAMDYETYDTSGNALTFSSPYVQYWTVSLP